MSLMLIFTMLPEGQFKKKKHFIISKYSTVLDRQCQDIIKTTVHKF